MEVYTTFRPLGVGSFSFPYLAGLRQRAGSRERARFLCLPQASILYRDGAKGRKMPGKQVKNWSQYEALRRQGYSKESAARIANAASRKKRGKKGRRKADET